MIWLSLEEHAEWEHICGRKGYLVYLKWCKDCLDKSACEQEHCIVGRDCI